MGTLAQGQTGGAHPIGIKRLKSHLRGLQRVSTGVDASAQADGQPGAKRRSALPLPARFPTANPLS